jgi:hypothetical protein
VLALESVSGYLPGLLPPRGEVVEDVTGYCDAECAACADDRDYFGRVHESASLILKVFSFARKRIRAPPLVA